MHALKETCALHCLLALHIAGPLPITQQLVMDITGFDDAAVRKGLQKLLVLGLVTCTGDKHRTAWQEASAAHTLPLPLDRLLPIPAKLESPVSQEEESMPITINPKHTDSSSDLGAAPLQPAPIENNPTKLAAPATPAQPGQPSAPPLLAQPAPRPARHLPQRVVAGPPAQPGAPPPHPPAQPASPTLRAPRPARHLRQRESAGPPAQPDAPPPDLPDQPGSPTLRSHFYAAFEAANVWLQLRRPLADALLADDGPGWLRQSLGWLCYAARRLPHIQRGAVLYISLRDRLPCDSAYLPPADLPFAAALGWALRGGEADEPPDTAAGGLDPSPPQPPAPEPETPEAKLWRAVLDRLSLELPRAMLEARLRETRLLSLDAGACIVGAPTPQARDWLANRLAAVLARTLKELTGSDLKVQIQTYPPCYTPRSQSPP